MSSSTSEAAVAERAAPAAARTAARTIDCDVHPLVPGTAALLPYLDDYWQFSVVDRGIESLDTISYPPNAPISARADWRAADGRAGASVEAVRTHVLEGLGSDIAILNCLMGVQMVYNEDMAVAFARAINTHVAREWLDRDPRLRASIVVPLQSVEKAVEEIEHWAGDPRFVQVLVLCMGEVPLGRRQFWPIYAAAERHRLPLGIHAGSSYHHPVTSLGWPSFYYEDYASQSQGFQSQLASLVCEGVFGKFPDLRVVLIESGVTWLPAFSWRLTKFWFGVRSEVPWVKEPPTELIRRHVRLTAQPLDGPRDAEDLARAVEHLGSDEMLLYASDYPHWQFDGDAVLPAGLPPALVEKMKRDNPLRTYPRLQETVS